jgi:hypothetical protein
MQIFFEMLAIAQLIKKIKNKDALLGGQTLKHNYASNLNLPTCILNTLVNLYTFKMFMVTLIRYMVSPEETISILLLFT